MHGSFIDYYSNTFSDQYFKVDTVTLRITIIMSMKRFQLSWKIYLVVMVSEKIGPLEHQNLNHMTIFNVANHLHIVYAYS